MKILSPFVHGILDFVVVIAFALAPTVLQFAGTPRTLCYVLAVVHAAMTLITAFPLGALKIIPFPVHGLIELVAAVFIILAPWILGFTDGLDAKRFYVAAGIVILVVVLLTDYKAAPPPPDRPLRA
jgi:hypothetical protein